MQKEETAGYVRHIVEVMKGRFGKEAIILFHVGNNYECFLEDSRIVSQVLGIQSEPYLKERENIKNVLVTRFPAACLADYRKALTDEGYATVTNEMRDASGKHILKIYEKP